MSILFVLLMFLVILTVTYLRSHGQVPVTPEVQARPQPPLMECQYGLSIPQGYSFHPGHTWAANAGPETARVGVDSFATNLLGKVDHIYVISPNRWIRQGQKLMTIKSGDTAVEMLSPVEGVITAVNTDLLRDPSLLAHSPYEQGWVAIIKSPDFSINQKNLIQGSMVAPWMQNNVTRLNSLLAQSNPALAQDGGQPLAGILTRMSPEMRQKLATEFFLS